MEPVLLQRQTLTPAMQTSLRVLQLNNLQLRSYLSELMNTNAVVELEYPDMDLPPQSVRPAARYTADPSTGRAHGRILQRAADGGQGERHLCAA